MRKIKFRGKRLDCDKIIYGDVFCTKAQSVFISNIERMEKVYPKTLGQFIGAYDVDGKEIYESDIVKTPDGVLREIFWNEYRLCWDMTTGIDGNKSYGLFSVDLLAKSEVVGNIHENPEFLKGAKTNES